MTREPAGIGACSASGRLTYHTLHVVVRDGDGRLTTIRELVAVETGDNALTIDRPSDEPRLCTLPVSGRAGLWQLLGLEWLGRRVRRSRLQHTK